jgi:UDP-N-acetylmuramyl pentapeptide synthase
MNIQISHETVSEYSVSVELATEKKSAFVSLSSWGTVTVCCLNAAHRVWRGNGRQFESFEEAMIAYKSSEMRSMIEAARDRITSLMGVAS